MIFVGTFNEDELSRNVDRQKVAEMKEKNPELVFTKSKCVKNSLRVWLLTREEYYNSKEI